MAASTSAVCSPSAGPIHLVPPGEAEKLALWDYAMSGDAKGTVAGKNWAITPARQLTFVHAVQRPLEPAVLKKLYGPSRAPGQTGVVVRGELPAFMRSTGWVVNLDEWRAYPGRYQHQRVPDWLAEYPQAWLLVRVP